MSMSFFQLPLAYLLWHYTSAWADIARLYTTISWFLFHFFSIKILLATLFAPWKRLRDSGKGHGGGGFLGHIIINTITRVVGLGLRLITIGMGVASLVLFSFAFLLFLFFWLFAPLIIIALLVGGILGIIETIA